MTERPERYAIVTGASESASARTMTVNRRAQALLAAHSSDAPAISGDTTPADEGVGIRRACFERREQERQAALREGAAAEEEVARREPIAPVLRQALRITSVVMFFSTERIHSTTWRRVIFAIGASGSCFINQSKYWSLTLHLKALL